MGNYKYKHIAEKISDKDIDRMIDIMINNYDINGFFYRNGEEFMLKNAVHSLHIIDVINKTAKKEAKNFPRYMYLKDDSFFDFYEEDIRVWYSRIKGHIYDCILNDIALLAIKKRNNRFFKRLHVGENIDVLTCSTYVNFQGKIEFRKDGGWGLADNNGNVIVKNHLIRKISSLGCFFNKNSDFRIIQDVDTRKYGVISVKTFKEVIHCLYDRIEIKECIYYDTKKYFLIVWKSDMCGCYDENCSIIVECRYDHICFHELWLECCRDGTIISDDTSDKGFIYDGVKDLYDIEGNLVIGGYNNLEVDSNKYFKFYFGTSYEIYYDTELDLYNNEVCVLNKRINYNRSTCLVLDSFFKTIFKINGQYTYVSPGLIIKEKQELNDYFPDEILLSGEIDLSEFNAFIFLKKKNVDKFIVPEYSVNFVGESQDDIVYEKVYRDDFFIEDDEVVVIRMSTSGEFLWRSKVNEIGPFIPSLGLLYRLGDKVGWGWESFSSTKYAAVTTDYSSGKTYVAEITHNVMGYTQDNPNYNYLKQYAIQYFVITTKGEIIRMEDDWKSFNPKNHDWFPSNFLERNGLVDYYDDGWGNEDKSYDKYGGYNGYDDDTIDYGFDGRPEATWNVE
jgi:hypothetical protein